MKVFRRYAAYYDLLYRDKDYAGEAAYVLSLIRKYRPRCRTILNLGCGTGRHDLQFAQRGQRMTGVDLSADMLKTARTLVTRVPRNQLRFVRGNVQSVRLRQRFDAVVSLFHVVNYQTTNADLQAMFQTARRHLAPGGLFVFDCIYGPTVLREGVSANLKKMEDERIRIVRRGRSVLYPNENRFDVHYRLTVRNKSNGRCGEINETHRIRYLFCPEIVHWLSEAGLDLVQLTEWGQSFPPDRHLEHSSGCPKA